MAGFRDVTAAHRCCTGGAFPEAVVQCGQGVEVIVHTRLLYVILVAFRILLSFLEK